MLFGICRWTQTPWLECKMKVNVDVKNAVCTSCVCNDAWTTWKVRTAVFEQWSVIWAVCLVEPWSEFESLSCPCPGLNLTQRREQLPPEPSCIHSPSEQTLVLLWISRGLGSMRFWTWVHRHSPHLGKQPVQKQKRGNSLKMYIGALWDFLWQFALDFWHRLVLVVWFIW